MNVRKLFVNQSRKTVCIMNVRMFFVYQSRKVFCQMDVGKLFVNHLFFMLDIIKLFVNQFAVDYSLFIQGKAALHSVSCCSCRKDGSYRKDGSCRKDGSYSTKQFAKLWTKVRWSKFAQHPLYSFPVHQVCAKSRLTIKLLITLTLHAASTYYIEYSIATSSSISLLSFFV